MLNLVIAILLMCSSLGITLSKTNKEEVIRKPRQHSEPLKLDQSITLEPIKKLLNIGEPGVVFRFNLQLNENPNRLVIL